MNLRKILATVLALVLALSMAACTPAAQNETTAAAGETTAANEDTTAAADETTAAQDETTQAGSTIKVTVVHADGSEKVFTYTTTEEFLGALLQAEGIVKGNDGPYGLEMTEVDGEKAVYDEDKAYWALYEGEEYALQGIDTTPIVDGGEYKLVYTPA